MPFSPRFEDSQRKGFCVALPVRKRFAMSKYMIAPPKKQWMNLGRESRLWLQLCPP